MSAVIAPDDAAVSCTQTVRKPDFFIVGAPKSGTTSLYIYLAAHPHIYMPRFKEPHYFSPDLKRGAGITSMTDYLNLFANANDQHLVCGEASTGYLRSKVAVSKILAFNPQARFIVMLRNPVELVYSYHSQLVRNLWEPVTDFEQAWKLQEQRARGQLIPKFCTEPADLQYRRVGMLGEQVESLLTQVPRERVKILVFDDLAIKPQSVYENVLNFLDVPSDHRSEFPISNSNRVHRSTLLVRLAQKPPFPLNILRKCVHGLYCRNVRIFMWFVEVVYRLNSRMASRLPLTSNMRRELGAEFHDDVRLLERLIDRDLGHWIPVTGSRTLLRQAG